MITQELPIAHDRITISIPPGRDPFVNTPLLALGPDRNGNERFWISTWNANVGCLAALVTEAGEARIYRFNDKRHGGFYSAAMEDDDTLWLCGSLSRVVRFSLESGDFEEYPTGAPDALVFQGMVLDRETGKLFALAHDMAERMVVAFSFDIRGRKTVQIHRDFALEKYMRTHFPNGDGSYTFVLHTPGETLLRWDPRDESLSATRIAENLGGHKTSGGTSYRLVTDAEGRPYFPHRGWYDPRARAFQNGPRPDAEATWFQRIGQTVWGGSGRDGNIDVSRWNLEAGTVSRLCTVPEGTIQGIQVSAGGKIVAVNKYGFFYRFDAESGDLEMTRRLDTDSIGHVDCLCRIDKDRLLGTPFITQRFWEANLRTGQGYDCGKAAPGGGEILLTWKLNGKVYMAAYTGGDLVEYDPAEHPHFPENPRVVAAPPHAMRPVAGADDGRYIFYACSTPYGSLGSTLTRYDTQTGCAAYARNPLPDQQIVSLAFDVDTPSLLCGTTMDADCRSCAPASADCFFAGIDPETLAVTWRGKAPSGTNRAKVVGPLGEGAFLCECVGPFERGYSRWFALANAAPHVPALDAMRVFPENRSGLCYSGIPGHFLMRHETRLELWDMRTGSVVSVLSDDFDGYAFKIQERSVYLLYSRRIEILENALGPCE